MTGRCKSQIMTPRWTWFSHFLIVFAVERGLLGSLTTEHKEPSLYSQTTKAGPAQQNSDFFQLPMTSKNRKCWTKMDKGIRLNRHTKKERTQNPSQFEFWRIVKFVRLCDSLQFGSHFVISGHPPGTSQHFHSQGLMCLCSPCGRDNSASRKKTEGKGKSMQGVLTCYSNMQ